MRPRLVPSLTCAAVLLATAGCGLLGEPGDTAVTDRPPAAVAPTPAVTPAAPPPPGPVEVARATLDDRYGGTAYSGTVSVTRSPATAGPPPLPPPFAEDCALPDDGSVRTVDVDVTFADTSRAGMAGLAADVALTAAGGGPPRAGAAVFVESSATGARWCQDGTTAPTTDRFAMGSGVGSVTTVTVHVVLRDALPTGDLVLRLTGLADEAGSNATGPWDAVTASAGACADDPAALCVPLG
ncbi:hypothetical protein GCM10027451_49680 [Geodermatophilus aquaeductus]|uniref:Uncharacterized protein n=1 Tax=Geodermatophilus aquaeductus TaxID=1564161 RepID=A0A521FTV2_9ACTN|nr:hypothetical protein [Geodermatophilus aquaeductus]SMO99597.1 hypothetical protein SAMN06273567_11764 [Geodermatophilus aquaeductus]